jgi:hypothetical protein
VVAHGAISVGRAAGVAENSDIHAGIVGRRVTGSKRREERPCGQRSGTRDIPIPIKIMADFLPYN